MFAGVEDASDVIVLIGLVEENGLSPLASAEPVGASVRISADRISESTLAEAALLVSRKTGNLAVEAGMIKFCMEVIPKVHTVMIGAEVVALDVNGASLVEKFNNLISIP